MVVVSLNVVECTLVDCKVMSMREGHASQIWGRKSLKAPVKIPHVVRDALPRNYSIIDQALRYDKHLCCVGAIEHVIFYVDSMGPRSERILCVNFQMCSSLPN